MRYYVSLDPAADQEPIAVDVTELPTGKLEVVLRGETVPVDVVWLDAAASIRVGGRIVDLTVEGQPPEIGAVASGHRSYIRVESERQRAAAVNNVQRDRGNARRAQSQLTGARIERAVQIQTRGEHRHAAEVAGLCSRRAEEREHIACTQR